MMWYALDVTCDAAAREAIEYALMEAGARGTEVTGANLSAVEAAAVGVTATDGTGVARVAAYFDAPPDDEQVRAALSDALHVYGLAPGVVRDIESRDVAECDWLAEWKKNWQPVAVGERLIIAPPWSEIHDTPGRIVLRIEPGMAFGTGTHETTRLCLAAIEKHFDGGSFLDVGTGTGILAIAAAKLHPRAHVEACDIDSDAITIAHDNALLNHVSERVNFRVGTIEDDAFSVDCVCANLTADEIMLLLPTLVGASCGRLILSGILETQAEAVLARMREIGIDECEVTSEGEWVALTV
ncbi:MAG: 50S ribosomal protein L11 methyltransferase [Acidobacteriota bacterium]|nr:50S ribosomal protein L11 methyltransferase [Acidobacteriota bacterium]